MFQGFSQGAVDFLWGVRFNNERSWFEAHKQEYLDLVIAPLQELGRHQVSLHWVKGHASNPKNNRCDQLAVAESRRFSGK